MDSRYEVVMQSVHDQTCTLASYGDLLKRVDSHTDGPLFGAIRQAGQVAMQISGSKPSVALTSATMKNALDREYARISPPCYAEGKIRMRDAETRSCVGSYNTGYSTLLFHTADMPDDTILLLSESVVYRDTPHWQFAITDVELP